MACSPVKTIEQLLSSKVSDKIGFCGKTIKCPIVILYAKTRSRCDWVYFHSERSQLSLIMT